MTGTFKAVVYFLGAALLLCVAGVVTLAATNHNLPDLLKEIAVGALAGLTGLLVHPGPADVTVTNRADQPVPVDAAPEAP